MSYGFTRRVTAVVCAVSGNRTMTKPDSSSLLVTPTGDNDPPQRQ